MRWSPLAVGCDAVCLLEHLVRRFSARLARPSRLQLENGVRIQDVITAVSTNADLPTRHVNKPPRAREFGVLTRFPPRPLAWSTFPPPCLHLDAAPPPHGPHGLLPGARTDPDTAPVARFCPIIPTALTIIGSYPVCLFPWLFHICPLLGCNVPKSQAWSAPRGIEHLGPALAREVPQPRSHVSLLGSSFACSRTPRGSLWLVVAEPGPSSEAPRPRGGSHSLPASRACLPRHGCAAGGSLCTVFFSVIGTTYFLTIILKLFQLQ